MFYIFEMNKVALIWKNNVFVKKKGAGIKKFLHLIYFDHSYIAKLNLPCSFSFLAIHYHSWLFLIIFNHAKSERWSRDRNEAKKVYLFKKYVTERSRFSFIQFWSRERTDLALLWMIGWRMKMNYWAFNNVSERLHFAYVNGQSGKCCQF